MLYGVQQIVVQLAVWLDVGQDTNAKYILNPKILVKQIKINDPLCVFPSHCNPVVPTAWTLSTENNNDTELMLMGSHWAVVNLLEEKIWETLHGQNAVEHITLCRDLWSLVEISLGGISTPQGALGPVGLAFCDWYICKQ
jgi:hypothetical protein